MKEIIYDGKVILNLEKVLQSDTIKGIEFMSTDPGNLSDDKIYIVNIDSGVDQGLYLRYNAVLYKIGEPPVNS